MTSLKKVAPLLLVLAFVASVVLVFVLFSSFRRQGSTAARRIEVAVSVLPQAYLVERVGRERVRVTVMIPPGRTPHDYEPSSEQVRMLARARVYVKVGHPLFAFEKTHIEKILSSNSRVRVIDTSASVTLIPDDPHIWLSHAAARYLVEAVRETLTALDPAHATSYESNARTALAEIEEVKKKVDGLLSRVSGKRLYVFHPAFGYLIRPYGITQVSLERGHKEPGPADLKRFIETARADRARAVIVQDQLDQRHGRAVSKAMGARLVALDPLSRDWPRSMLRMARAIAEALR